jgi:hypothetical protein
MLELEKIMEIGRVRGSVVVPVFYKIDPSQVRHQKGQFGKGFDDLISKISVDESTKSNWRRDLIDIGGIAGFVLIHSRLFIYILLTLFFRMFVICKILRPKCCNIKLTNVKFLVF